MGRGQRPHAHGLRKTLSLACYAPMRPTLRQPPHLAGVARWETPYIVFRNMGAGLPASRVSAPGDPNGAEQESKTAWMVNSGQTSYASLTR